MRKGKFIYLKKNDQMLEDDNVYVVVSSDQLTPILKAFGFPLPGGLIYLI